MTIHELRNIHDRLNRDGKKVYWAKVFIKFVSIIILKNNRSLVSNHDILLRKHIIESEYHINMFTYITFYSKFI